LNSYKNKNPRAVRRGEHLRELMQLLRYDTPNPPHAHANVL
jgi:hypothetical protein